MYGDLRERWALGANENFEIRAVQRGGGMRGITQERGGLTRGESTREPNGVSKSTTGAGRKKGD